MQNRPPFLRRLLRSLRRIIVALALVLVVLRMLLAQPSFRSHPASTETVSVEALRSHVDMLAVTLAPRNWRSVENLYACGEYIAEQLRLSGAEVQFQLVPADNNPSRNVVASFQTGTSPRIILGAHYDGCMELPGADDNASGLAVLLELARMFGAMENPPPVDLVAYTYEEPPYFGTHMMGSAVHAKSLEDQGVEVQGVIVLEMVGYYSDKWFSQKYPMPMLYLMYPNRGNFIGVVSRWDQGPWIKEVKVAMKGRTELPVYSIRAPDRLPGIDFSDHRNYWPLDIPALMVTDTAFYRNHAYHTAEDTPDRLDYERMAQVTVSVFEAVKTLLAD